MHRQPLDYPLPNTTEKSPVSERVGTLIIIFSLAYFGIHLVVAGVRHVL